MGRRTLLLIASILVAALGTALIWLYVQGADTRAVRSENQVSVYVAAQPLTAGAAVGPKIAMVKQFPQSVVAALHDSLVTSTSEIQGYAKTDIVPGLPLLTSQFTGQQVTPAPAVNLRRDEVAMQVTLPDPQRLAGLLQPGSHIRVYAQMKQKNTAGTSGVGVLFQDVRVLGVGPATGATATTGTTGTAKTEVPQAIITLALHDRQPKALVLAMGSGGGTLWFGLLPAGNAGKDDGSVLSAVTSGAM
jgi:pilus assembly protein CpaB